jgi:hypothetical protein
MKTLARALQAGFIATLLAACATPTPFRQDATSHALVHQQSGFVFPERVGPYRRTDIIQYDTAGKDVSAGYVSDLPIAITVYVYPTMGLTMAAEIDKRRNEVLAGHTGGKTTGQRAVQVTPQSVEAHLSTFTYSDNFAGRRQELSSQLVLALRGSWFVAYRITYPESDADIASEDATMFLKTFPWP